MTRPNTPRVYSKDLKNLVIHLRDDFSSGGHNFILLYAYNGTGKTRLSMAFKERGKQPQEGSEEENSRDTLYFNAFTEDLFTWDNDLDSDSRRVLKINSTSKFFDGLKDFSMDIRIREYLDRYVKFEFFIDYEDWEISFYEKPLTESSPRIKISRGEERIFVWCFFLAILQLVFEGAEAYRWVKYVYIDDPISSLDDNNAVTVASDLAKLLYENKSIEEEDRRGFIISSHHALFFNILYNELKKHKTKYYFLNKDKNSANYTLRSTEDTPFFHHIAMLSEIRQAIENDKVNTYHFNMLRSILEKTAVFFGHSHFSYCLKNMEDDVLYARALQLLSHGKYSIYEPRGMQDETQALFKRIFDDFLSKYGFDLPEIFS